MKHIKAMTFITNPIVNSYKRFVPGFEAPVHIAWSRKESDAAYSNSGRPWGERQNRTS